LTSDPETRRHTFEPCGPDFANATPVVEATTVEIEDTRRDDGEHRVICFGVLAGRMVVLGYTPGGTARHAVSTRKANEGDKARLAPYFRVEPGEA
jgi:uncharacterized DUF497 family protein